MNKLLWDLINIGKVVAFIDDVIAGTEEEEGHDELVAEVIKRLEENDLYVKPEKYKWKMREVEFLEIVIGLEGIKIEEEKVKGIMTNTEVCQRCTKILRIGKLLPPIY